MIKYVIPHNWLNYDIHPLIQGLVEANAAVLSLVNMPYQKSWIEALQAVQLKYEVAGTSKIEGADFTERELDLALKETAEQLITRSQKQAAAAANTYRWIAKLPNDLPIDGNLIADIHARIVTGSDDDHCAPGKLRKRDENVNFGVPKHRGSVGGEECEKAFKKLEESLKTDFQKHDRLIQALALHYHFAAMHPFLDGNGRTARAVEALMLQRAGLTDHLFIAMSNYYYDEKTTYLSTLSSVTPPDYDLTPFLLFGLKGIKTQCERLFKEIRYNVSQSIFKNTMLELFGRLQTKRKTVIAERHMRILNLLLEKREMPVVELLKAIDPMYQPLKAGSKAKLRDLIHLLDLGAINMQQREKFNVLYINLDWPKQITENGFMESVKKLPKVKSYPFLSGIN